LLSALPDASRAIRQERPSSYQGPFKSSLPTLRGLFRRARKVNIYDIDIDTFVARLHERMALPASHKDVLPV
jgi:hypothetical protein